MNENFTCRRRKGIIQCLSGYFVSEGGTEVALKDEDNKVVVSFKTSKKYHSVVTSNGEQGRGRTERNAFRTEDQEQGKDKKLYSK